jgi:hypothetical protein
MGGTNKDDADFTYVLRWRLTAGEWDVVLAILEALGPAGHPVDQVRARRAHQELDALHRAVRLGSRTALPAPAKVRERVDKPIRLDIPPADETATGPASEAPLPDTLARMAARLTMFTLPVFDRGGVAFADTEHSPAERVDEFRAGGMLVVIRALGRRQLSVTVAPPATVGELIALTVSSPDGGTGVGILLPVWLDENGVAVAAVEIPARDVRVGIRLSAPFPATALEAADSALIMASAQVSGVAGRSAWLGIASSRAPGDGVRAAIAEGLR